MLDKENSRKKFAFRKEKERLRTTGHKSCVMEEKKKPDRKDIKTYQVPEKNMTAKKRNCGDR